MGNRELWNPPKDLISKVYDCGKKKKKKNKKLSKGKERARKDREILMKHYGLHKYATNIAICHAVSNDIGWPMPEHKNQQNKFMRRAVIELNPQMRRNRKVKYTSSEEFYKSQAWRDLRYIALKNSNGCCDLCGARASDGVKLHVDHIKPRSKYPQYELDLSNLQVLCQDCNFGKSNIDETNWRQHWDSIRDE